MKLWFMTEWKQAWSSSKPGSGGGSATPSLCVLLSVTLHQGEAGSLAVVGPTSHLRWKRLQEMHKLRKLGESWIVSEVPCNPGGDLLGVPKHRNPFLNLEVGQGEG